MKKLGNISYLKCELSNPEKFKNLEIKDMNQLNLIAGANGTGKTFVLVLMWCINTLVDAYYRYKFKSEKSYRKMCENIFKYAFTDLPLDGQITAKYKEGLEFNIVFTDGVVMGVDIQKEPNVIVNSKTNFMSKSTRTYSEINRYYLLKQVLVGDVTIQFKNFYNPTPDLQKLLEMYKVYDIMFLESLKETFIIPKKVDKDITTALDTPGLKALKYLLYDNTTNRLVGKNDDDSIINLDILGAGEQSMLNMLMSSKYVR